MDTTLPPLPAKSTATNAPSSVHTKPRTPLLLFILLLIAVLGIATPFYFVWQSNAKATEKSSSTTVVVDTQNQEIKAALEKEFVYTSAGPTNYYSPTLDTSFKVDPSAMYISEGGKSISISPKGSEGLYGDVLLLDTDPVAYYKDYYKSYDKINFSGAEQKVSYQKFTFTYEKQDYLKKNAKITVNTTVLFKFDEQKKQYIVAKVAAYAPSAISTSIEEQYVTIIKTATIAPTDVAPEITAELSDISAKVKFDKKKWTVSSQSDNYLSLTFITQKYEEPYVSLRVSGSYFSGEKNVAALEKLAAQELGYAKRFNKNVTVIAEKTTKKIAGQDTVGTSYSYDSGTTKVYAEKYYGFSPSASRSFEVSVTKYIENQNTYKSTYADEDIKKVIDTGISFVEQKQASTSDTVLGESSLTIEKPALIGKLGTVHLATTVCTELLVNDPLYLPTISGKKIPFCYSSTGSGFFVNTQGHIVTNAHVAADNPFSSTEDLFTSTESSLYRIIFSDLYASYLKSSGYQPLSEDQLQEFATLVQVYILTLIGENKITFTNTEYSNYLETDVPFAFDSETQKLKSPEDYIKLSVVKANPLPSRLEHLGKLVVEKKKYADNPYELTTPDLAILKADSSAGQLPTLLLNSKTLIEGTPLLAIGFPGVADNRYLFSDSSSMSATITKGTISAIKNNATNSFKLIQTDASINRGNSGGPMVNENGEVVGVSTYLMTSDGGNYGAGVSVDEVAKLLSANNVTVEKSPVSTNLVAAIDNMQKSYFTWAIRDFEAVLAAYPQSKDLLNPLKQLAQEKIESGEDNTPILTLGSFYIHKGDLPFIIGGLVVLLVALLLAIVLVLKKKKKSTTNSIVPGPTEVTTVETVPPLGANLPPMQQSVIQEPAPMHPTAYPTTPVMTAPQVPQQQVAQPEPAPSYIPQQQAYVPQYPSTPVVSTTAMQSPSEVSQVGEQPIISPPPQQQ